jgi:hypothetical protein
MTAGDRVAVVAVLLPVGGCTVGGGPVRLPPVQPAHTATVAPAMTTVLIRRFTGSPSS